MVDGAKLVECRKKSGLKAFFVAEQLGVKRQALYLYEQGRRNPSIANLEKLADLYGVSVNDLLIKG